METSKRRARVVAIAGGSASGKSTFATALIGALMPSVSAFFAVDRYNRRGEEGAPTFRSPTTGEWEFDMNHPDSYNWDRLIADIGVEVEREDGPDYVIVEGLMVLHHEMLRNAAAVKIFVDLDADIRALRRMLRDMAGGRQSTDPAFIARYYIESARVGHALYVEPSKRYADLILRGDSDFGIVAAQVANGIAGMCDVASG